MTSITDFHAVIGSMVAVLLNGLEILTQMLRVRTVGTLTKKP